MNAHAETPTATADADATRAREKRARNRWLDADTIADALREKAPEAAGGMKAETGNLKDGPRTSAFRFHPSVLILSSKALGFSWNRNRGAWQHTGGVWKPASCARNTGSPEDAADHPRAYGKPAAAAPRPSACRPPTDRAR